MPISSAGHSGVGLVNQKFPLWDFGAIVYWNSLMGSKAQLRGGGISPADDFGYTYVGAAATSPWTEWDPGKGRYVEHLFGAARPPKDGHFAPTRTNSYNANYGHTSSTRGPMTNEGGLLTALLVPPVAPHIIEYQAGGPAESVLLSNFSGSAKRTYRLESSSATTLKMWSCLVRRNDGAKVDASTCSLGVSALADPLGANIATGTTRYDKIRNDGWYRLSISLPVQGGAPDVYYWLSVADGVSNLVFELPQVEGYSASISEPTSAILNTGSTRTRNKHIIEITGSYTLPKEGWMAATIIPLTNAADLTVQPFAEILTWRVDDLNRNRFIYSTSSNSIKFFSENAGATQADLGIPQVDVLQGVPLGVVATWGQRAGSSSMMLCVNGSQEDIIDTINTPPTGTASMYIGSKADTAGSTANVKVQHAAFGNKMLTRHDARNLSNWFQRQAFDTFDVKGS